jgi:hypothetical protein
MRKTCWVRSPTDVVQPRITGTVPADEVAVKPVGATA